MLNKRGIALLIGIVILVVAVVVGGVALFSEEVLFSPSDDDGGADEGDGSTFQQFKRTKYTLVDLGILPWQPQTAFSDGIAVNNEGFIAGHALQEYFPTAVTNLYGQLSALGIEETPSYATDINDFNVIVGHGVGDTILENRAFRWENGAITYLIGESNYTVAFAINNQDKIVGYTRVDSLNDNRGFVWQFGEITLLDNIRAGYDINENDQIACRNLGGEACILDVNTRQLTNLGSLGSPQSYARDINDLGNVVGDAATSSFEVHAFFYNGGAMLDLGTLGGTTSKATGINNMNQVVGWSTSNQHPGARAFIWENGEMTDLNSLLVYDPNPAGSNTWILESAEDISDSGYITGHGRNSNGARRGFVLIPIES